MIVLRQRQGLQRAISAVLVASYLLVLAMAASPALHHWLHDDANEPDHQCAAATVLHGQVCSPPAAQTISTPSPLSWFEPLPALYAFRVASIFLLSGVMEHAPPARD